MKLAVIFAVLQMSHGVVLKGCNNIFFRSKIDLIFECIPQFIILFFFFGYMDILIIIKWLTPMDISQNYKNDTPEWNKTC